MFRDEPPERKGEAWGMLDFSELRISLNQLGRPQSGAGKPVSFFFPTKRTHIPQGTLEAWLLWAVLPRMLWRQWDEAHEPGMRTCVRSFHATVVKCSINSLWGKGLTVVRAACRSTAAHTGSQEAEKEETGN